ncbi:MAG: hypothetical protein HC822_12910 [Oscillochloris sp.]|nr:hypothetical protein [Oscillochloris sp.]
MYALRKMLLVGVLFALLPILAATATNSGENLVTNGGFEQAGGWQIDQFQPLSQLSFDDTVAHSGRRSAKIVSSHENDTRFVQTIHVQPHSEYLLSGWIKTEHVARSSQAVQAGANLSFFELTFEYTPPQQGTNDWTYVEMPFNSGDHSRLTLAVRLGFYSGITAGTAWFDDVQVRAVNLDTQTLNGSATFGNALSVHGSYAAISNIETFDPLFGAGTVAIYQREQGIWTLETELSSPLPAEQEPWRSGFGASVALADGMLLIGAQQEAVNGIADAGAVYVYVRSDNRWQQQARLTAADPIFQSVFGHQIVLDETTAVIDSANGLYVFERTVNGWVQQAILPHADAPNNPLPQNRFSLSDNRLAVGDPNAGNVSIYVRWGSEWRLHSRIDGPGAAAAGHFGATVALEGLNLLVGAPDMPNEPTFFNGTVYAYRNVYGVWTPTSQLNTPYEEDPLGRSGQCCLGKNIVLHDDIALVQGFIYGGSDPFSFVNVYRRDGLEWRLLRRLTMYPFITFGRIMATDGYTLMLGIDEEGMVAVYDSANFLPQPDMIDDFVQTGNRLAPQWAGGGRESFVVQDDALIPLSLRDQPIFWKPGFFQARQSAQIELVRRGTRDSVVRLLLKVRGNVADAPLEELSFVRVSFATGYQGDVVIESYRPGQGWRELARRATGTLRDGSQLRAVILDDGLVRAYLNGELLLVGDAGYHFAVERGRIGLQISNPANMLLDSFAGGSLR